MSLNEKGDLVIDGWDLGDGVEGFFGEGNREYEWTVTIKRADVPKLVKRLDGSDADDILELLAKEFAENPSCVTAGFMKENGIACDVWSRMGD